MLRFADNVAAAASSTDIVLLAVGTPSTLEDGEADLRFVFAAVDAFAEAAAPGTILVSKSTVPVGTADAISDRLARLRPRHDFEVVSCPEFLREGSAIGDFLRPHRIVIGTDSERVVAAMRTLYAPLLTAGVPLLTMDRRSAELSKYASNAFLATKLAFMNEMADFAENVSADIGHVAEAMGLDPRIGGSYLSVGPGFGGSCFPKDTMALHRNGEEVRLALRIVETVIGVNEQRKRAMARRIIDACGGNVANLLVAVLGVTFKPDTDDLRETPALPIIRRLQARGAEIVAFDPALPNGAPHHPGFANVSWRTSVYDAVDGASAAAIITDWDVFRTIDLPALAAQMASPRLIDFRNLFRPEEVTAAGLDYYSVGREPALASSLSSAPTAPSSRARSEVKVAKRRLAEEIPS